MEILSPVGNKSSLIAAVRSGADAVYFGVENFNARRNAENFKTSDLKEISSYCHIRGVKAYLTLNTVISDNEFKEALNVVKSACEAGIDAIIINDLGLANEIKKAAPNMQLHASTQMTVHNIDGVKYLKEKGFSRVVLARENSLKQIEEISNYANEQNIELEIFVQGAHCMSVSGQCLLSSVLGGRSGNRGLCAQPCRLPFKVKNGNGYDLSLKDMNLFHYFDEFYNNISIHYV
ncbi:MAG: U32 family peptidase [Clostridia bacterium]|nr:U32 family peptidase [Clostridia bacterium]